MPTRIGTPPDYYSPQSRGDFSGRTLYPRPHLASDRKSRKLALLTILGGLCTLFVPLVTVAPPVANIAHWSPIEIALQMYEGHLPSPICERCGEPLVRSVIALPFTVTIIYLLMLGALISLSIPYTLRITAGIGAFGAMEALYLDRMGTKLDFCKTFYGHSGHVGHVNYGLLQLALLSVMVGVCVVSLRGDSH